jgi:hypothetical protein
VSTIFVWKNAWSYRPWPPKVLVEIGSQLSRAQNMAPSAPAIDVKSLHAKIGELTLENDFLEGALTKAGLLSAKR